MRELNSARNIAVRGGESVSPYWVYLRTNCIINQIPSDLFAAGRAGSRGDLEPRSGVGRFTDAGRFSAAAPAQEQTTVSPDGLLRSETDDDDDDDDWGLRASETEPRAVRERGLI